MWFILHANAVKMPGIHSHVNTLKIWQIDTHHPTTPTPCTQNQSVTPPGKYQLLKSLLWYWTNYFYKRVIFIREEESVHLRNCIVIGCPCVCTSILKSTHRSDGSDPNQEEWRFLSALILVYLLCLKTLDKEGKEMTAGNNKNSIK